LIILDEPYVSQLLKDTILEMKLPVLKNKTSERLGFDKNVRLLDDQEFIELLKNQKACKIYSNSEISLVWISDNLGFTGIPEKIGLFKDKLRFRELIDHIYPDFSYQGMEFGKLEELDIESVRKPFIIKPAVGFFSAGVYKVSSSEEWKKVLRDLKQEMETIKGLFPVQVFSSGKFILEDYIEGPELAVDAYYNSEGKPVILDILEHLFPSEDDVEDKVYVTSKKVIETYLEETLELLKKINEAAKLWDSELRNFPLHIELRVDKQKRLIPVEVNPIRFAGWCTADIAYYAYGINVHRYFLEGLEPDWREILKEYNRESGDRTYCLLIAKKPDDIKTADIEAFDYESFVSRFEMPLELRKLDYRQYPVFAFLFTETGNSNWGEIDNFLKSDLKEYIRVKTNNCS
jgi:hypothetical protein